MKPTVVPDASLTAQVLELIDVHVVVHDVLSTTHRYEQMIACIVVQVAQLVGWIDAADR